MTTPLPGTGKTITLADTRWGGHHPTYLREFTASLLRLGARVHLLCRDPQKILDDLPPEEREAASTRVHGRVFIHRNHGVLSRQRDHDPLSTLDRWRATGRETRAAEAATGHRSDLVFFAYLDSYLRFTPFPSIPGRLLDRPWSGLYFRNAHFEEGHPSSATWVRRAAKGDRILRAPGCRAICVLDERFNGKLAAISGHPVHAFPDMTDESPPDGPSPQARGILEQARGRKIIGLISMEKRKGLITFLRAARQAHEQGEPWFFVATGPFAESTFTAGDLAYCRECADLAATGRLDNLALDLSGARIPDGKPYNALFTAFDLVWAAYEDFEGSSNALTKAAVFRIPVVATAGQCVGARVEQFHLGNTFRQGDSAAAVTAIRSTLAGSGKDGQPLSPAFAEYHQRHSRARLDEVFGRLMETHPTNGQPSR